MPSELGLRLRSARQARGIGLRELAKSIGKSPGFLTQLECDDDAPSVSEETLRAVAAQLELDADELLVLAHRTPSDVVPGSALEVALYRRVKELSPSDQERVRLYMERTFRRSDEG